MNRDELVEKMAEALWDGFAKQHLHPADWPSWGELLAQGHQGMHRVNEFRAHARAALAVAEPVIRNDCAGQCAISASAFRTIGKARGDDCMERMAKAFDAQAEIMRQETSTGGTP